MSPGLVGHDRECRSLLIVAEGTVTTVLRRVLEDHVELKKVIARKGINRILCTDNIGAADSAAERENVRLALIHASLRGDPQIASNGVALLKRMRFIHKARFPVIILSFDKALAVKEAIFEYPKDRQLKRGQYLLVLPCFVEELERIVEESVELEPYQLQTVIYYYCSILDFVQKKGNSIQHDLQHLKTPGDEKREREKYYKELEKHIRDLQNAVGEKVPKEIKVMEEQLAKLMRSGSRLLPSEVDTAAAVFGETLSNVESVLGRKP